MERESRIRYAYGFPVNSLSIRERLFSSMSAWKCSLIFELGQLVQNDVLCTTQSSS